MHRVLIIALVVLSSSLVGGAIAANSSTRAARNPMSAADWKVWMAMDANAARLYRKQTAPEYAKCAKLKTASAVGLCDAKPLSEQARRIGSYVSTIGHISRQLRAGQCRLAMVKYEFGLQAAVSAAIVVNKELILADKVVWKSARALEKQIKSVLGANRANAEKLCKP
jgi:hypothetical protein